MLHHCYTSRRVMSQDPVRSDLASEPPEASELTRSSMRVRGNMLVAGSVLLALAVAFAALMWSGRLTGVREGLNAAIVAIQDGHVAAVYLSPIFWILIGVVLILEKLFPAMEGQPVFSTGFVQDAGYFVLISLFRIFVLTYYVAFLAWFYEGNLSMLTIDSIAAWPVAARLILAILVADFLGWFHHWVRHMVPTLWKFHTIHHSQEEINIFTDVRYHPLEYVVSQAIIFIPVLMLGNAFPLVLGYAFVHQWFTKFYHANIRTNLGPLRYVLVTPQSHRIHHSHNPEHRDKNFGVVFSIWDRMFGTQYHGANEYPEAGVDDELFPSEQRVDGLLRAMWQQMLYPFRAIARDRRSRDRES